MLDLRKLGWILTLVMLGFGSTLWAAVPGTPTQFSVSAGNANAVLLWTAPLGTPTSYIIYQNLTPVADVTAPSTSYLARSLVNGTTYTFSVSAKNASGEGVRTADMPVIPAVLPQAPTGVTATAITTPLPLIQLQWNPVVPQSAPIAGYTVYRALSGTTQTLTTFSSTTSWVDTSINTLNAFGSYYYQVTAVDQWGNTGAASASLLVSTAPLLSTLTPNYITPYHSDGQLYLEWQDLTATTDGFQVNLLRASDNSLTVQYTPNSYTAFAVPNNGEVYFVSVAPILNGSLGTPISTTTAMLPPTVQSPAILAGNGYVQLNWAAVPTAAGILNYKIYGDAAANPTTLLSTVPATQTSYLYTTSDTNFYSIRAVNATGESPQVLTVTAAPTGTLPSPPQKFAVSLGLSQSLIFSWTLNSALDNLTAYRLYALDGPFTSVDLPISTTITAINALTNGQSYRFFLTAINANGESPASLTLTAAPMAAPISALATVKSNTILITWNEGAAPSGVTAYQVYRTNSSFSNPVLLTTTAQTACLDRPFVSGTYYYRLNAQNSIGQTIPDALAPTLTATILVPPTPPDTFKLTAGDRQVQILWRKIASVTSITTYNIYRSTTAGTYSLPILSGIPSKDSFITDANSLTNTSRYFYTMTCVNDAGESTRSAEFWAIPYKPAALPDDSTLHTSHERREIKLQWDSALPGDYPIVGYNLYRSTDGGGTFTYLGVTPVSIPQATATRFVDTDINYGAVYLYRLHPMDFDSTYALYHEGPAYALARVDVEYPNNRLDVLRNAFNPAKGEVVPIQLMQVQPGRAWLKIYNLAGEHIRTLWDDEVGSSYTPDFPFILYTQWDGKNTRGETVASGVYMIHTEGQSRYHQTRKIAVIK